MDSAEKDEMDPEAWWELAERRLASLHHKDAVIVELEIKLRKANREIQRLGGLVDRLQPIVNMIDDSEAAVSEKSKAWPSSSMDPAVAAGLPTVKVAEIDLDVVPDPRVDETGAVPYDVALTDSELDLYRHVQSKTVGEPVLVRAPDWEWVELRYQFRRANRDQVVTRWLRQTQSRICRKEELLTQALRRAAQDLNQEAK